MKTPTDRHEQYSPRFLEAVGCTAEVFAALDWSDHRAVARQIHPKATTRLLRLIAEKEINRNPPGVALAWWHMANTAFELGDVDDAIEQCQRGIEVNAGRPGVRDLRQLLVRLERERMSEERSRK
jgi:hypothetical protein